MPSPQVIKKRIEGLIEREYLARTPEDRSVTSTCSVRHNTPQLDGKLAKQSNAKRDRTVGLLSYLRHSFSGRRRHNTLMRVLWM